MPKLLILSAEEKSYRRTADGQTIIVDDSAGTVMIGSVLAESLLHKWNEPSAGR